MHDCGARRGIRNVAVTHRHATELIPAKDRGADDEPDKGQADLAVFIKFVWPVEVCPAPMRSPAALISNASWIGLSPTNGQRNNHGKKAK